MKPRRRIVLPIAIILAIIIVLSIKSVPYFKNKYRLYKHQKEYAQKYEKGDRSYVTYSQLVFVFQQKKEYDNAINLMEEFLRKNPHHYYAYAAYGSIAITYYLRSQSEKENRGKWQQLALVNADNGVTLLPKESFAHYAYGELYEMLGEYQKAIYQYEEALELLKGENRVIPGAEIDKDELRAAYEKAHNRVKEKLKFNTGRTQNSEE
jgi:tetratricopeptide (TPR) repeat protein